MPNTTTKSKKQFPDFLLPSRNKIIKFLNVVGRPQTRKELAIAFNVIEVEIRRALGRRLKGMLQDV